MRIRHIAFDLDGTLLDTRDQIVESLLACLPLNLQTSKTRSELYDRLDKSPRAILAEFGISDLHAYWRHHANLAGRARLFFEDTPLVLNELGAKGLSLSVITSLPAHPTATLLDAARLKDSFSLIDTFSSRPYRKPSPKLLALHLQDLKVSPGEAVYVGDRQGDMRMGSGAGASAWGVGWGGSNTAELIRAGADRILKSMRELLQLVP
jgi:phosphoglycolate phosphatase-like HAD superfamily hydrolase